jgi:hypothetical protein
MEEMLCASCFLAMILYIHLVFYESDLFLLFAIRETKIETLFGASISLAGVSIFSGTRSGSPIE